MSEQEKINREAATHLRGLAKMVEDGVVTGFEASWHGGKKMELSVSTSKPAEFAVIDKIFSEEPSTAGDGGG